MAFYFYTETAFHHEGDFEYLKKLIDASAEAGANGIKFQVIIDIDNLTSSRHSFYEKFKSCVFTKDEWTQAFQYCDEKGLDVIMMPLDNGAFELISDENPNIKYIDLHSVSFYDEEILAEIKKSGVPLIIGVGGRNLDEINDKREYFGDQFQVIMSGFQAFPSKLEDIKLGRIKLYKKLYPKMKLGYADHSGFESENAIKSNEFAYLLGATFFEKHITVDEGKDRLDFQSALGMEGVKTTIGKLKYLDEEVFKYCEEKLKEIVEPELTYRNRQKVAVAKRDLQSGEMIKQEDIVFKMTETGKGEQTVENILNKELTEAVQKDEAVLLTKVK